MDWELQSYERCREANKVHGRRPPDNAGRAGHGPSRYSRREMKSDMSFDFLKYKENQYLVPLEIENKKSYYYDLINIEHSFTGRVDAWLSNTFIHESVQLIINAINLFELGYFDCAYYSLRQALELSTTMVYLVDIDENKREVELKKWKSEKRFPLQSDMMRYLDENGAVFKDLKEKLSDYFEYLNSVKSKLNKFVHKQGLNKFYVSRNHPINGSKSRTDFINEFVGHLITCIGAVAIFRLSIDPFPILLNDDEIFHRTGDLMTSPYSEEFIKAYIGYDVIESYKKTEIYLGHYEFFITEEKKKECVTNVVKHQCIDIEKIDGILEQQNLLSETDLVAVLICKSSYKIAKVYTMGGLMQYFTSRNTVRTKMSWDSRDFEKFKKDEHPHNIPYDEAFISCFVFKGQNYFAEHNVTFSADEIEAIRNIT